MPVKHWSFAGLVLTYWCNVRCASCYLRCAPDRGESMSVDKAVEIWRQLIEASPHGCRIHLGGGEPFGDWPTLLELCRRAKTAGLSPLEKIETNAFWACDEPAVRDRLRALDDAGMGKLCISADPYHQQFVPIACCRLAARVASELLGADRVQVRWRDWLAEGFDTAELDDEERGRLFGRYAESGRDRLNGRAAECLAPRLQRKNPAHFADTSCAEAILRSRHIHVDGTGRVMPGTCAGILLGRLSDRTSVRQLWESLAADHAARPIIGTLARAGPVGLMQLAESAGFVPFPQGYASKCHLCWEIRRRLVELGAFPDELGPAWMYEK